MKIKNLFKKKLTVGEDAPTNRIEIKEWKASLIITYTDKTKFALTSTSTDKADAENPVDEFIS